MPSAGRMLDIHAHAMPLALLEWLEGQGLADLSDVDPDQPAGIVRIDPQVSGVGAGVPLPLARSQWDVTARLAEMDASYVYVQAVSLPPFLMCSMAQDADLVAEVVSRGNQALAELTAQAPQRLVGLGSVPLGTPQGAAEVGRLLDAGMRGVAIGTRGMGCELDDAVNEPLWEVLAQGQVFCFLHPSGVPDAHRLRDYYLPQLLGYPMETAIAVTRLVMSGVRERHAFPLCLAHGGGCLPWVRGRLDLGWERKEVARAAPRPPGAYLDDLFYDTAVFSPQLLGALVDMVGIEQLMVGTDFPFELAERAPRAAVEALGLDDSATHAIAWGNAARLLGLDMEAA